jgi:histone-lysine N-methyltransferase SETMAR
MATSSKSNSKNFEQRAVMKYLNKAGKQPGEIHADMVRVLGEDAPSLKTVYKWVKKFKWGRESLEDDPRSGRPSDVVTPQNIERCEKLVMQDRRIKLRELAAILGMSKERVGSIVHEHLRMRKLSARWVPRNLSLQDRHERMECSRELLGIYEADEDGFVVRVVTGDETWLHHWDPESKQESMQWKHKDSPPPKKFRTQPSAGKIMASIFWDCQGLLLIDYMPHKTTITGQYYAQLMGKLKEAIKEKRRGKLSKGILLLHDNAPVHKSKVAQAAIRECGFEQLNHPPYSPDLAPSDYYLFRQLKSNLRGQRFADDEELKSATETWFEEQSEKFYFSGISSLKEKWSKCVEVEGDYIEK